MSKKITKPIPPASESSREHEVESHLEGIRTNAKQALDRSEKIKDILKQGPISEGASKRISKEMDAIGDVLIEAAQSANGTSEDLKKGKK